MVFAEWTGIVGDAAGGRSSGVLPAAFGASKQAISATLLFALIVLLARHNVTRGRGFGAARDGSPPWRSCWDWSSI
jgi:hypothetical protein